MSDKPEPTTAASGNSLLWVMIKGRWLYLMCWLCWPIIQINPNVYFYLEQRMIENKRNGDRIYGQIKRETRARKRADIDGN